MLDRAGRTRHSGVMRRVLACLLAAAVIPGTWWRSLPPPRDPAPRVAVEALPLPRACCALPGIRIDGVWHLTSRNELFGGYSALIPVGWAELLALSDGGRSLLLPLPDKNAPIAVRFGSLVRAGERRKNNRDVEAATWDSASKRIWLAFEGRGVIERRGADLSEEGAVLIPAMRAWPGNSGPEAMVRLRDGRFVVLAETHTGWTARSQHPALLFAGDPVEGAPAQPFTFRGAPGYRPTDMAQLPDGRVLMLMRRLVWPFPARFAARLMIADPADLRPGQEWQALDLGEIAEPVPVDNYEGLALVPEADGSVTGWIISDDNGAALQRTLLLRLRIDPAALPRP